MTKKPRDQLDSVMEKEDEEQTTTVVKAGDGSTRTRTVTETRRKTEENKENAGSGQMSDDSKQMDLQNACDKNRRSDTQRSVKILSPTNIASTQVSLFY